MDSVAVNVEAVSPQGEVVNTDAVLATENTLNTEASLLVCVNNFKTACLLLKTCKEKQYYKFIADSWSEYIASIGLTMSRANKMVRFACVWDAISRQVGNQDDTVLGSIDIDRLLNDWLPCVKYNKEDKAVEDAEKAVELLEQAKILSHSDFQAIKDQHRQTKQHPEVQSELDEGPVLDENKNVVGNYRTTRATGNQHYFNIGIKDEYIKGCQGQELKVFLGRS